MSYIVIGAVVSVDDFNNYVNDMHDDRDRLFENEYSVCSAMTVTDKFLTQQTLK